MTTREQYNLAYKAARTYFSYMLILHTSDAYLAYSRECVRLDISPVIMHKAFYSYRNRTSVDLLGVSYRNLRSDYVKIRAEITLGHY